MKKDYPKKKNSQPSTLLPHLKNVMLRPSKAARVTFYCLLFSLDVRVVGFFTPSPAEPLPTDLEEFMQSSHKDGVILVSFGSIVGQLEDNVVDVMIRAFAKLPQKILWKINLGELMQQLACQPTLVPEGLFNFISL